MADNIKSTVESADQVSQTERKLKFRQGDETLLLQNDGLNDEDKNQVIELSAATKKLAVMVPVPDSPVETDSVDEFIRVDINPTRFTVINDWVGTRIPRVAHNVNDPLFHEYLALSYSADDFVQAAKFLMSQARDARLMQSLGLRAFARVQPKSIPAAMIRARMQGFTHLSERASRLAQELLIAMTHHLGLLSDQVMIQRVTPGGDIVPSREQLGERASIYRLSQAFRFVLDQESKMRKPESAELNPASIDSYLETFFKNLVVGFQGARRGRYYLDIVFEAMRVRLLRDALPDIPEYISENAALDDFLADATMLQACMTESKTVFDLPLIGVDTIATDSDAGAKYMAYQTALEPAIEFVSDWLSADPFLTTVPLSTALDAFSIERVKSPTTNGIRGGIINFHYKEVDGSASLINRSEDTDNSFVTIAETSAAYSGNVQMLESLQPRIGSEHSQALLDIMANVMTNHERDLIATFVRDKQLLQFAAMARADSLFLQLDTNVENRSAFFANDLMSAATLMYRFRFEDTTGFESDLGFSVLSDLYKDGTAELTSEVLRNSGFRPDEPGEDGIDKSQPFVVDHKTVHAGRFAVRVGTSEYVHSIDPRIVLLATGPKRVTKAWESGMHRLDVSVMHKQYVSGVSRLLAPIKGRYEYYEPKMGRFGEQRLEMNLSALMNVPEDIELLIQPTSIVQMESFMALFDSLYHLIYSEGAENFIPEATLRSAKMMMAQMWLNMMADFIGTSSFSRVARAIQSIAFSMQKRGKLSWSLRRFPDDDRRLALFILRAIYITSLGTFTYLDDSALDALNIARKEETGDERDAPDGNRAFIQQVYEIMRSEEFAALFATSSVSAAITF